MLRHAPGFLILFSAGNLLETCPWGLGTKILGGHVKEKMADKTAKSGTLAYSLHRGSVIASTTQ